jgi:hypothetical protein
VQSRLAVERERERTEERAFDLLEARTIAEREQALMISTLQYSGNRGEDELRIACQHLGEHLPDYQFLSTNFQDAQKICTSPSYADDPDMGPSNLLTILKAHRCYNEGLANR